MSYREVFESLQELFPQVDQRILKAAAIEHANNIDDAVEFILQDVIPSIPEHVESSEKGLDNSSLYESPPEGLITSTQATGSSSIDSSILSSFSDATFQKGNRDDNYLPTYSYQNMMESEYEVGVKVHEADAPNGLLLLLNNNRPVYEPEVSITRSTHSVTAEALEEIVSDAKSSKMSMLASIDKLATMAKNVLELEDKASITKEEASVAGKNNFGKVGELRKMITRAKEANNLHAGEVYGERSILSTEARELQTRLLSLSNEKNKFLETMEEIQRSLEERLAAAEDEISTAEMDRMEREESARRALKEQEEMMAVIVNESKKLQHEAEENTKLRDFLEERGRIVDSLQGEIAVLSEDITKLKEIVQGRMPMTKSILSTISTLITSSSSSSISSSSQTKISSFSHKDVPNSDEKIITTANENCNGDNSSVSNESVDWALVNEETWATNV